MISSFGGAQNFMNLKQFSENKENLINKLIHKSNSLKMGGKTHFGNLIPN